MAASDPTRPSSDNESPSPVGEEQLEMFPEVDNLDASGRQIAVDVLDGSGLWGSNSNPIQSTLQLKDAGGASPTASDFLDPDLNVVQIARGPLLTNTQKDQVARMLVAGVPRKFIAASYNLNPNTVANWDLQQEGEWATRKAREGSAVTRAMVETTFQMHALLPKAVLHITQDGFNSSEADTRLDTSWRLLNYCQALRKQPPQEHIHTGQLQVDNAGLLDASNKIATLLEELRATKPNGPGLSRVKQGPTSLPGPSAISEIEAKATPSADEPTPTTNPP